MKNLNKKLVIYIVVIVLILILILLGYFYGKGSFSVKETYQVVQLLSGDVYYGKLSFFPSMKLTDVYLIQTIPSQIEGGTSTTQLVPLKSLFFAPENTMYLNKEQILWWADLSEESQILQTIKGQ